MRNNTLTQERADFLRNIARDAQLITLNEAAPILGISERTLYQYARDKKIDSKKIAGRWRFTATALRNFAKDFQS